MRDVDTGQQTLLVDPGTNRTSLAALQTVEISEYGAFYIDAAGNAVFQDRALTSSSIGSTPTVFADDGTGIEYSSAKWVLNDNLVYNDASITATGLATQTASDATSIATYFTHSYKQTDLLMDSTQAAKNYALAYVASRKDTSIRCDSITLKDLNTPAYTAGVAAALGLDYFDTITVKSTQPAATGTSTLNKTLQIFGVSHAITVQNWTTRFTCLEPIIDAFLISNAEYGQIGINVLSY
jgi:D-serine deaminase-like pyridoxal phosphate-dependent protein